MGYQVIARKWRPKTFSEVVGQPQVVEPLMNAIQKGRVAHAYLFSGPRGVGKTSVARILAKALNCMDGPTPYPCGRCGPCMEIAQGTFMDVLEMDAASNRGIEDVKGLRENVKYAPAVGRYKVYIIDEVHMLSDPAFNALLKTLEEPPSHVIFILATTEPQKIPPTILSRCQHYHFRALPPGDVKTLLAKIARSEGLDMEEGALELLARASGGSLRDGEMLLEQVAVSAQGKVTRDDVAMVLGLVESGVVEATYQALVEGDQEKVLRLFQEEVMGKGYDAHGFVEELAGVARDRFLEGVKEGRDVFKDQTLLDLLLRLMERVKRHPLPEFLVEMELVRMASLDGLVSLDELVKRVEALQREMPAGEVIKTSREVSRRESQRSPGATEKVTPGGGEELGPLLKEAASVEQPSLCPILDKLRIYLEDGYLVLESKYKLGTFERERLEDEASLAFFHEFLKGMGHHQIRVKLKDNGERILEEEEKGEPSILEDPRVQRAMTLFRARVRKSKGEKEE